MRIKMNKQTQLIETVLNHLKEEINQSVELDDINIFYFIQSYPNTSGPFGGIGGQLISGFPNIVLFDKYEGHCYVYLAGKYFYTVERPTDEFFKDIFACNISKCNSKRYDYMLEYV